MTVLLLLERLEGSGGVTLAGMAAATVEGKPVKTVLKQGIPVRMFNAMEEKTGFINQNRKQEIEAGIAVRKP